MTSPDQASSQTASLSDNDDVKSAEDAMRKMQEEYATEKKAAAEALASHLEQHKRIETDLHKTIASLEEDSHDMLKVLQEDTAAKESSIIVLMSQVEKYQRTETELLAALSTKEDEFNANTSELESYVTSLEEDKQKFAQELAASKEEASSALAAQVAINCRIDHELQEALVVVEQESKGLQWEEKCVSLKKCNADLTNEVATLKETVKKQRAEVLDLSNSKRKTELDFQAQREGDARIVKDLEKKINDKQMAKKKKEQDEWEATDRQVHAMESSLEEARKLIRQECAQRIKELEDKLRDSDTQLNGLKTQVANAQRELASSRRKAKKIQQGATLTTEKVVFAPDPSTSNVSPVEELKQKVKSMSASSWGLVVLLVVVLVHYLIG